MLGWLFGSDSGAKVMDKISSGVDAAIFTNEEKTKLFIEYQKATLPQNLARRILAFMVVGSYLLLVWLSGIFNIFDLGSCAPSVEHCLSKSQFLFNLANETLLAPTTVIISFYFLKRFKMGGES